jgi:hypothetical protein
MLATYMRCSRVCTWVSIFGNLIHTSFDSDPFWKGREVRLLDFGVFILRPRLLDFVVRFLAGVAAVCLHQKYLE